MCLQDLQLARAELLEVYEFAPTGPASLLLLPANRSRTRIVFAGPTTGSFAARFGGSITHRTVGTFSLGTQVSERVFDITSFGNIITQELWASISGAMSFFVYEYSLPVDPDSLQRLAATGKW